MTGTCQKLQDELARSGADVDRLTGCLKRSDEESRALTDSLNSVKERLELVTDKVHIVIQPDWSLIGYNTFWLGTDRV